MVKMLDRRNYADDAAWLVAVAERYAHLLRTLADKLEADKGKPESKERAQQIGQAFSDANGGQACALLAFDVIDLDGDEGIVKCMMNLRMPAQMAEMVAVMSLS